MIASVALCLFCTSNLGAAAFRQGGAGLKQPPFAPERLLARTALKPVLAAPKLRSQSVSPLLNQLLPLRLAEEGADSVSEDKPEDVPAFYFGLAASVAHLFLRFWAPRYKSFSRLTLAAFILGGASMRLDSDQVEKMLTPMVPPPLPPKLTVYASGLAEAICGVLLLIPSVAGSLGAISTVALFWAIYPSNIYAAFSAKCRKAQRTEKLRGALYVRILIQLLFIYWASWFVETKVTGPLSWFVW